MDCLCLTRILALSLLALPAPSSAQAFQAPAPLQFADLGGPHVDECAVLKPATYPPTSGEHFPI